MTRVTFANSRIVNRLGPGLDGGQTLLLPGREVVSISEAAARYRERGVPLIVLAGRDYGMGSSRDWAAKGPALLGVKAVIAASFERIHRSNLIGMGILPLTPIDSTVLERLDGSELLSIVGLRTALDEDATTTVLVEPSEAEGWSFECRLAVFGESERSLLRQGGIFPAVYAAAVAAPRAKPEPAAPSIAGGHP